MNSSDRGTVTRLRVSLDHALKSRRSYLIKIAMKNAGAEERSGANQLEELNVVGAVERRIHVNAKVNEVRVSDFRVQLLDLPTKQAFNAPLMVDRQDTKIKLSPQLQQNWPKWENLSFCTIVIRNHQNLHLLN